ncbi:T9SS type A sorting domain-containing protein [Flavobacterium hauense]
MKKTLLSFITSLYTISSAFAQLSPDTTFGNNGLVRTTLPFYNSVGTDVAFQPDGKIVACGYSYQDIDDELERNNLVVTRYNPDGTFDFGFGPQNLGRCEVDAGSFETTEANFVRVLPDGKIVAAVVHQPFPGSARRISLIRFLQNGFVDIFFGQQGGQITLNYNGEGEFYLAGFEVLPDGKFLLGCHLYTSDSNFALMRINADGQPDTTFGPQGLMTYNFGNPGNAGAPTMDAPSAMKIQTDGKILLGGYTTSGTVDDINFGLMRLNADGSVDTTFGQNGRAVTVFGGGQAIINAISIASDGKIYASGTLFNTSTMSVSTIVARYLANGTADATFGANGKVITTTTVPSVMTSSVIQPDGKLLLLGYSSGSDLDFACLRYNNNGLLDTGFGTSGLLLVDFGDNEAGNSARFQADGKLVLVGDFENATTRDIALMRFNAGLLSTPQTEEVVIRAFPNPFTDTLIVEGVENPDTITIFDSLGRRVDSVTSSAGIGSTHISMPSGLSLGVYLLTLKVGDKSYQIKIVKQ